MEGSLAEEDKEKSPAVGGSECHATVHIRAHEHSRMRRNVGALTLTSA